MPSLSVESADDHPDGPSIRVDRGEHEPFDEPTLPALVLGRVKAYVDAPRGSRFSDRLIELDEDDL